MTDKLIMTTAQRDAQYAALENSIDAVTQEITDHKTMWGEEAIPSRASQRQHLVLKEREHKDAMEMLQSLPMISAEPVAWQIKFKDEHETQRSVTYTHNATGDYRQIDPNAICEPLYTSPQALTTITADDVTDEMLEYFNSQFTNGAGGDNESMLVAAYNAVIKNRSEAR